MSVQTHNTLVISSIVVEFTKNNVAHKATMSAAAFRAIFVDDIPVTTLANMENHEIGLRTLQHSKSELGDPLAKLQVKSELAALVEESINKIRHPEETSSVLDEAHRDIVKCKAIILEKKVINKENVIQIYRTREFVDAMLDQFPQLDTSIMLRMVSGELRPTPLPRNQKPLPGQEEFTVSIRNYNSTFVKEGHPLYSLLETKLELDGPGLWAYRRDGKWSVKLG